MKELTNLKKLKEEPKLTLGVQMYETYQEEPTYQKIKRKPKLQKVKRKR